MSSEKTPTRTRILAATWRLLESGRSGVRMSDIAREAGVSRQAVYLHFPNRAELLVATVRHIDEVKDVEGRLAASRAASTGAERLDAFIDAWAAYIPEIHGVGKALMAMQDDDAEAAKAWADRMEAVRQGCAAAVRAIAADGRLAPGFNERQATDLLWTLVSVRNWEQLTRLCGWSQDDFAATMKETAARTLLAPASATDTGARG